jgi:DNA-binding NtrC family response regulator
MQRYAGAAGKTLEGFAPETLDLLSGYRWPGNVRELEHAIERAVALARSAVLLPEDLPPEIRTETAKHPELPSHRMTLDEVRRWYVATVLEETGGNKVRAAEILGIDRRTLYRILDREEDPE